MDLLAIDTDNMKLLQNVLDLSSRRLQLISSNIANADTPGYHTKDLDFSSLLKQAAGTGGSLALTMPEGKGLGTGSGSSSTMGEPQVIEPEGLHPRNDGNNVNTDREMANLANVSLQYSMATQLLTHEFGQIRSAIKEGSN